MADANAGDRPLMTGTTRWLALALAAVALVAVACHHDSDPAVPMDPSEQPLPPASGTPIGFLIDDSEMHLSAEQLGKLRDIDTGLQAQLDQIDKATRSAAALAANQGSNAAPQQPMGRHHRGGMGGGMGGGGMGGGGGGGGGSGGHHHGSGGGSAAFAATTGQLADERTSDVKYALERAFVVLDPAQRARAKQVLSDHDVDLDLDGSGAHTLTPDESEQLHGPGALGNRSRPADSGDSGDSDEAPPPSQPQPQQPPPQAAPAPSQTPPPTIPPPTLPPPRDGH